jgi:hypothetical protein
MADKHYEAEVNKGDLNVSAFERELNDRWQEGWQLHTVLAHGANTVVVWERRGS